MARTVAVGGEDFIALRRAGSYYVDKTELLYELFEETNNTVTLFTRPRRFGKTLTMSMIESFFSMFKKEDSSVFEGLDIMRHPEFCEQHMHQYPVLSISLKDVEGLTFEEAYAMLLGEISGLASKYYLLEKEKNITDTDAVIFRKMLFKEIDKAELKRALQSLMRMMNSVYGKPVILLIDEYDVPLAKAYVNGYYREMLDVIRGLMSASLKTNEYLKFAVVTGCLRIPKESIFTGVNNFASYSVMDEEFAPCFGFTGREVEVMLEQLELSDKLEMTRKWYDGYLFGNTKVYCPWDVMNYVAALLKNKNARPKNYWENTSGNDAIRAFFDMEEIDVSDKFETLLNGGAISQTVTNALSYDQAYVSELGLWSILLMTGYVTMVPSEETEESPEEGPQEVVLRIPNREIAGIFQTAVADHFQETVDRSQLQELMSALWAGEEGTASEMLSDLLWETISYMDYHENYYHAFMTGIFVGRGGYSVQSNKERGLGRPDIDLRDKKNRRAMLIETKRADSEEQMEACCGEALRQIEEMEYAKNLEGYRKILCYGIAFYKKQALVRKMGK